MTEPTVHILYPYPLDASGSGVSSRELAERLGHRGMRTHLLTIEPRPYRPQSELCRWDGLILGSTFPLHHVPVYTGIGRPFIRFEDMSAVEIDRYTDSVSRLCRETLRPVVAPEDVILVSHLWFHSLILESMAIPVHGLICHGTDLMALSRAPRFEPQVRLAAEYASRIVANSDFTREQILQLGLKAPKEVVRIYPGINVETFVPRPEPRSTSMRRILHVPGKLARFKGTDRLLAAARVYGPKLRDVETMIVAHGRPDSTLQDLYRQVSRWVRWREEWIPQAELSVLLATADVLVAPSRDEPFGMLVAEALACGTPVVVDNSGGVREVVGAEDGFVVQTQCPESLAEAIGLALEMDWSRSARERRAARAAARFGWPVVLDQWCDWIEAVRA